MLVNVPFHCIHLKSELVSREVLVAACPASNGVKLDADAAVDLEKSFRSDLFLDPESCLDSVNTPILSTLVLEPSLPQSSHPDKTPGDLMSREIQILEQSQDSSQFLSVQSDTVK